VLTPLDIQNKEFRRAIRGYSEQEVDEFLDEIVREFEGLIRDGAGLKDQLARLEQRLAQYTDIEELLKRTLISAEEAAGDLRAAAQKEADLIVREAREQARREIDASQREAAGAEEALARTKHAYRAFLGRAKAELRAHLESLESMEPKEVAPPPPPAASTPAPVAPRDSASAPSGPIS
jgi:cell division initiation protein